MVVPAMLAGMLLHDRWFAAAPVAPTPVVLIGDSSAAAHPKLGMSGDLRKDRVATQK